MAGASVKVLAEALDSPVGFTNLITPPCAARSPVSPPMEWGEARIHRRDRLGGVVHEYVLAA
jgi:hypothetical protein